MLMEVIGFFQEFKIVSIVVHVIGVVFGMGGALVSDLLFSFFSKDKELNNTEISILVILKKVVLYGLYIIIVSGAAIFLSDIERYTHSTKFLAKMSILSILLVNGVILNKYIWPHVLNRNFFTLDKERNIRKLAFVCGAISVISWLSLCTLGVIKKLNMSYWSIILIYALIILFGMIVSLFIEKRELN